MILLAFDIFSRLSARAFTKHVLYSFGTPRAIQGSVCFLLSL